MDCTKEAFLEEFGILKEEFKEADISWEDLLKIETDYVNRKNELEKVRKDFMKDYIIDKSCGLHSFSSRIKDQKHLIAKIIRKRYQNYTKYQDLTVDNYYYLVTDLIGVRGLILYREDWIDFHKYILERFKDDKTQYVKEPAAGFNNVPEPYMAEPPKVYIRKGDYAEIYDGCVSPDNIADEGHYRSIHYNVKYHGQNIEIQIRTLFEEGWGK